MHTIYMSLTYQYQMESLKAEQKDVGITSTAIVN